MYSTCSVNRNVNSFQIIKEIARGKFFDYNLLNQKTSLWLCLIYYYKIYKIMWKTASSKYNNLERMIFSVKVLYLLNHAGKAGTERYVQTLVEKLNNKQIEAHFAYNEYGLLVENLKKLDVPIYQITMRHPFDIKAVYALASLCKELDINLIHTQFLRENYIALLSRLINPEVKVIYTNHFVMKNNFLQKITNTLLTRLNSFIIAVCNKGKEVMISNGVKKSIIKVIFNGVDVNYWGTPINSTLKEEYNIGENVFVLTCASRFAHDKGHKFLINAIKELKSITNIPFKCVLANDGPLLDEIKQMVKDLDLQNDVIFTGFRKDVKNILYGSDLYINASEHEALSFAIIEALACSVPVIATNMAGNGDIINSETNCGLLVQYDHSKELAEVLQKIISNKTLQEIMKNNALKTVRERFNLDNVAEETYNLYKRSCG